MCYLNYLLYVLVHKWYVLVECWKVGLYWRGLTHDLSKFHPVEFKAYADTFYRFPDKDNQPGWVKYNFAKAGIHHVKNNPHHWQHHVVTWEGMTCYSRPKKIQVIWNNDNLLEMVCDWRAMARVKGGTAKSYYLENRDKIFLHSWDRPLLEKFLGIGG